MHISKIKIGSRASRLAQIQVDEVLGLLLNQGVSVDYTHSTYETRGDRDLETSLMSGPADDFFTDTVDQALLRREIDAAVHSAKDLPENLPEGLSVFALTKCLDETDAFVGQVSFRDLSQGAKIGTSSQLRQKAILELNPGLQIVDIRGTIEQRISLIEQGQCDGVIIATAALKRLGLNHLIKDIMPWLAMPLQGHLAVVGRSGDVQVKELFQSIDIRRKYGKVTLVGAGPGDPDLVTVKGTKALADADCVFYDYLVDKALLDYAPMAEKIYVGKRKGQHTLAQDELSKMLRDKVFDRKNVVRLKGGDPLIFGRGADEIVYLKSYFMDVDVIPGVSSATGIPSGMGIPLTARGVSSSVAFVSGHSEAENKDNPQPVEIPKADTVIFMMGLTKLGVIIQSLKDNSWDLNTPMIVISKGTMKDETIVSGTIGNIQDQAAKQDLKPPALMIAGQTVKFWRQKQSRQGDTLYLGTNPGHYKALGNLVHVPMIEISGVDPDPLVLQQVVENLQEYDIVLLTSRFGVKYFFEVLSKNNIPLSKLKMDIVVIGRTTAGELQKHGLRPALTATTETSGGLFEVIAAKYDLRSKKILFPRSNLPNPFLKDALVHQGAQVQELTVYQNIKPPAKDLPGVDIKRVIFSSPSTVKNFLNDYGPIPGGWRILSKGPRTQSALKEAGYESEILLV